MTDKKSAGYSARRKCRRAAELERFHLMNERKRQRALSHFGKESMTHVIAVSPPLTIRLGSVRLSQEIQKRVATGFLTPDALASCLNRHARGDWGDIDKTEKTTNDNAARFGGEVRSTYHVVPPRGYVGPFPLCVQTESDRNATTVFSPEEL